MKRHVVVTALALVFTVIAGAALMAQQVEVGVFNVQFKFMADEKPFPPGEYSIQEAAGQPTSITLLPAVGKGAEVVVPVITRLAAPDVESVVPRLVFDVVGGQDYLSEVWLPGRDGLVTRVTKEAHKHEVLKGQRKSK
jgi:hypothetical protein